MQNLSLFMRLGILLVAIGALYFIVLSFDSSPESAASAWVEAAPHSAPKANADNPEAANPEAANPDAAKPTAAAAALNGRPAFNYPAPKPVGGKMRGVVELGASGFNSFIVRTDAQRNWELQKSEFDNSLLMENLVSDDIIRVG